MEQLMKQMQEKPSAAEELNRIGLKVLNASRTELYLAMHFLAPALDALPFVMDLSTSTVGTDAFSIRFHPRHVLSLYLDNVQKLNRKVIHMLMHCLLRHMFSADHFEDRRLWNLCSDIAAESVIDSMEVPAVARVTSDFRERWYETLTEDLQVLTAERLYRYFESNPPEYRELERLEREFLSDDHGFWERMEKEPKKNPSLPVPPERQNQEELWKNRASRMKTDLLKSGSEASDEKGSLERVLSLSLRERRDYRKLLRSLSVIREEMHIDPDDFDYGLYQYGLRVYGNLPLIEETELRERKKVEDLVIAIDTSGSCQPRHVRRFLSETASILSARESFFHRIRLRILECDDQIQADLPLTSLDELKSYAESFSVRGGFGTDFRPVFRHVEELLSVRELRSLRGLIYFTDGRGVFPEKKPPWETIFLFVEEKDYDDAKVPKWAEKALLTGGAEPGGSN